MSNETIVLVGVPERFMALAQELNIDPADMLQSFAHDLVDGIRSNGSDERQMAMTYFKRTPLFTMHLNDEEADAAFATVMNNPEEDF